MSLRARLLLTVLSVAAPVLALGVVGYRQHALRASDEVVAAAVIDRAVEVCANQGNQFTVALPRRSLFAGGTASLVVTLLDPQGVAFDGARRAPAVLLEGGEASVPSAWNPDEVERLVTLPSGRCRFALVRSPAWLLRPIPPPPVIVLPVLLAVLAVTIGVYPLVRRARALTNDVRHWQVDRTRLPRTDDAGDELGELSRALSDAAQTLQQQHDAIATKERGLREFVENVNHDLATPLTVLQGHLSDLARASDSPLVRAAMNEAQYLASLLGTLAVTAKFEAGVSLDGSFDLTRVVERVHARHVGLATRKGVALEHATPGRAVLVRGDETFAEQALTNLVGNAVQSLGAGQHVSVVLDAAADSFSLTVADDGAGLSEAERAAVLQRGVRGEQSRQREPRGQGLGLSIVARVAAVHQWTFTLEPNRPQGLLARLAGTARARLGSPQLELR